MGGSSYNIPSEVLLCLHGCVFFFLFSGHWFPQRVMPYIPKGVLKRNWIEKHLRYDPAVVVIFYDCDWDDESWTEKISECSSRVQSIR